MTSYTVGIDIGGTTSVVGLVDKDGKIVRRKDIKTPGHPVASEFFNSLADIIEQFDELKSTSTVLNGIGVGAPNGNYYNGTIEFAPNLEWKGVVPVVELLQKRFPNTLIKLTNDANAAALGEMIYGNAKDEKYFILITLGTGVGSGIVVDGKLVYGHDGFAGEIGHTIYDPEGRQCGCGRKGCLETYASAGGLVKTAVELLSASTDHSSLRSIPTNEITSKQIGEAAQNGDIMALKAFDITAKILAIKLADSVAHTSPSAIYIFGGLANAGDVLMTPLKKYFEEYLLQIYKNKIKLTLSGLPANDAAILGSAALVY